MSIPRTFQVLNTRLSNLEHAANEAPEGTYDRTKELAAALNDASQAVMDTLRRYGLEALNDDRLREMEAVIYGYMLVSNPDETAFHVGEGFGEGLRGEQRERVMANCIRDRDFLRNMKGAR